MGLRKKLIEKHSCTKVNQNGNTTLLRLLDIDMNQEMKSILLCIYNLYEKSIVYTWETIFCVVLYGAGLDVFHFVVVVLVSYALFV